MALRVIIDDGDDEVAEAKKQEKALAEHVARHPEDEHLLSEISEWDHRFERHRASWIELAAGHALTVVVVSLLAAGYGNLRSVGPFAVRDQRIARDQAAA